MTLQHLKGFPDASDQSAEASGETPKQEGFRLLSAVRNFLAGAFSSDEVPVRRTSKPLERRPRRRLIVESLNADDRWDMGESPPQYEAEPGVSMSETTEMSFQNTTNISLSATETEAKSETLSPKSDGIKGAKTFDENGTEV